MTTHQPFNLETIGPKPAHRAAAAALEKVLDATDVYAAVESPRVLAKWLETHDFVTRTVCLHHVAGVECDSSCKEVIDDCFDLDDEVPSLWKRKADGALVLLIEAYQIDGGVLPAFIRYITSLGLVVEINAMESFSLPGFTLALKVAR